MRPASILRGQQYTFGVKRFVYGRESVVDEEEPSQCVVSTTDLSQ